MLFYLVLRWVKWQMAQIIVTMILAENLNLDGLYRTFLRIDNHAKGILEIDFC